MVKKRNRDLELLDVANSIQSDEKGSSDDEVEVVNVDFEWFNFKPEIDFHGVKTLLRQLFDIDSQLFDLSSLTDLILSQPTIGSTVKVDGEETDAYAIMTILNLHEHRTKSKVIQDVFEYLLKKSSSNKNLVSLEKVLKSPGQVGLIFSERLINVPAEVAPSLYKTLRDEIEAAVEDSEPYNFTHYLILSKTYQEVVSILDEDLPRAKKNKADNVSRETFYFHAEDEVLQKHASLYGTFDYTNDQGVGMADSKRAFSDMGIKPRGSLILIEANKFENAVAAVDRFISQS